MTVDELIAVAEYKSKHIKAHVSPSTFEQMVDVLIAYKELLRELNDRKRTD